MPGFDGTGPRGLGPFTGRGEGYCAVVLPEPGQRALPRGYAGIRGVPLGVSPLPRLLPRSAWFPRPRAWQRLRLWAGRGRWGGAWRGRPGGRRW
jgi:hypothetical protein